MTGVSNIHHNAEVQINFPTWEKWNLDNLTNDGVILFQYLVFKCKDNAEWSHSDNSIKKELGIKRTRLTSLRDKLADMGVLFSRAGIDQHNNKMTFYRIDFNELTKLETLKEIYREKTPNGVKVDLKAYSEVFGELAKHQPKLNGKTKEKQEKPDLQAARAFAAKLEEIDINRRKDLSLLLKKDGKHTLVGHLRFGQNHVRALKRAMDSIGDNYKIECAFLVFIEGLLANSAGLDSKAKALVPKKIKSPLGYFLNYSPVDGFTVINLFWNYLSVHYGVPPASK